MMAAPTLAQGQRFAPPARVTLARLLLAGTLLIVGACSSLPVDVERIPSQALEDTSGTGIGQAAQPLVELNPGLSGFHVLTHGADAFGARVRMINAAEKTIDSQYYIWHDDKTGGVLHNRLLAAADRGVRVRLLLDDLDTAGKDRLLAILDNHPNIEVRVYNPFANRTRRNIDFITSTKRVNRRMHNKTLTVDNQATIFGGRNIGDEYFAADEELAFGDLDALAIGPIVQEVSSQFDLYWNSEWVYPHSAFKLKPPLSDSEITEFRRQSDALMLQGRESQYARFLQQTDSARAADISKLGFVWSKWLLAYDQPSKVEAKKVTAETHLAPQLLRGIDQTSEDLIIVSPYFVPGEEFTAYLSSLVARGVRVRILTNSLAANDVSLVHSGYMRYRKDLVAGGVELFEFKATRNRKMEKETGRNRIGASRASLHAKFFGFDQKYMFIGSFNLDARSVALNTELGAYFKSPEYARELGRFFEQDILTIAYQVKLDEDGDLIWVSLNEDGSQFSVDKEPDTSGWQRFNARLMSWFVPESQL